MLLAKTCRQHIISQICLIRKKSFIHPVLSVKRNSENGLINQHKNHSNNAAGKEYFGNLLKTTLNSKGETSQEMQDSEVSSGNQQKQTNAPKKIGNKINLFAETLQHQFVNDHNIIQAKQINTNNKPSFNTDNELKLDSMEASDFYQINIDDKENQAKTSLPLNEVIVDSSDDLEKEIDILPVDEVAPVLRKSFNFAPYIEKSETLKEFVKLGVELHVLENNLAAAEFILKLDFKDVQNYLQFLNDKGIPSELLGKFITKNPLIFRHTLENLQIRINYLESKKFSQDAISRIITKLPIYLNLTTTHVDKRLGYFQKSFSLSGNEIRDVITRQPKLITWNLYQINEMTLSMRKEFGFSYKEIKSIFLNKPKIWLAEKYSIQKRFDLIHNKMGVSHNVISKYPGALLHRAWKTKQRHLFLQSLNRAQYDTSKENYVSLHAITSGTDSEFCKSVAKTPVYKFNEFLKTLYFVNCFAHGFHLLLDLSFLLNVKIEIRE